ncbi:hypothetical protein GOBAR_DD18074 [Gossypium barbadense]|nr:hypothetical protein GOBAR_DD18074 [Gossypium barbadense]
MADATFLVSLLQPAPETFDLFDDIILMAEGKILYHGPRDHILDLFENCGFRCPPQKAAVLSKQDQARYCYSSELPYSYFSVDMFSMKFKASSLGKKIDEDLLEPLHVKGASSFEKELNLLRIQNNTGQATLESRGLNFGECFFWMAIAALFGFAIVYNIGFTFALCFLKPSGWSHVIISREKLFKIQKGGSSGGEGVENGTSHMNSNGRMMVLPFEPLTLTFQDVQYYIDTPLEMRKKGYTQRKLQLISNVTGALRPGILTALMGTSGAGKTTLLDVLAGRKTIGCVQGEIKVDGKKHLLGYPEFVKEVLEIMELNDVKDALAGIPYLSGLSTAQRKLFTIAVELVANPFVIFMDEPITSLVARAAAIVMRAVKNVANTGRNSCKVIEYFESITGVPKIKDNCNPATWMLEVTSSLAEDELGADFVEIYKKSSLHELVQLVSND